MGVATEGQGIDREGHSGRLCDLNLLHGAPTPNLAGKYRDNESRGRTVEDIAAACHLTHGSDDMRMTFLVAVACLAAAHARGDAAFCLLDHVAQH